MQNLYLIDGHAVMYRYHHAFYNNPLITSKGINTSATWGMANLVTTILKNYPASHIAVIFDPPYRTWRKELYPEYKANRTHADDLTPQLEMAFHMLKVWGVYSSAFRPLEADDALGILAKMAEAQGIQTYIVTKDKDFCQLVNDNIKLLDLGKTVGKDEATIIDRDAVKARHGVFPEQIVDYLTLLGDTSDNVPGVEGVGKKGASELLTKYGTLDEIYKNIDSFTKKRKENFEQAREGVKIANKLINLALEYKLPVTMDNLIRPHINNTDLLELFEEWEFYSVIKAMAD